MSILWQGPVRMCEKGALGSAGDLMGPSALARPPHLRARHWPFGPGRPWSVDVLRVPPSAGLRARARARAALAACAMVASLVAGCGRKVSDADCRKVADHLAEVWAAEAKKEETDGPA